MDENNVYKDDIPYMLRAKPIKYFMIIATMFFTGCLIFDDSLRPGLLEVVVGSFLGIFLGWINSITYINYMKEIALKGRDKPWYKWYKWGFHPFQTWSMNTHPMYVITWMLSGAIAFFGSFALLILLHKILPPLYWPFAKNSFANANADTAVFSSGAPTMVVWMIMFMNTLLYKIAKWYETLEDRI